MAKAPRWKRPPYFWDRRGSRKGKHSGTNRTYMCRRLIQIDWPLDERMKSGKFKSWRQEAAKAGIIYVPSDPDEASLERLYNAWRLASQEIREVFLALIEDWEEPPPKRRGPAAAPLGEGAHPILAKLQERMTMAALAKALGVSRETVRRWCSGQSKPRFAQIAAMKALAEDPVQ